MVNIQKSGDSAIKFTFTDNDRYLYDGEITVPLNSLILVLDESDMVVIKKVDGDVFLTFLIGNTNFSSKADLESWFKENACGATGGGSGSGVTSGEVQTMIDDSISGKADTSAVTASITAAVSGKQDTLVSGTNIKTINNESILGSGNIDIQGGGGKAIEAGRGIAITTGATADTVSFNLPISGLPKTTTAVTDNNLVIFGTGNTVAITAKTGQNLDSNIVYGNNNSFFLKGISCSLSYNKIFGQGNEIQCYASINSSSNNNFVFGSNNKLTGNGNNHNFLFGDNNEVGSKSHNTVFGTGNNPQNQYETIFGKYSVSHSGSTDADKSLFSVGNGTSSAATHNAFEIRQNGDIYITKDGSDVKLQDQLGGGLPESAFTAYTASTEQRLAEDEEVTAAALNALNTATAANTTALGGLKLVQLTQVQYDALVTKDANTLYVITGSN